MATHKAGGSTSNGRDSKGRRLGLKKVNGQRVISGNIIIRQRGTKYYAGSGVSLGKDHTIFAVKEGIVSFKTIKKKVAHGSTSSRKRSITSVSVI